MAEIIPIEMFLRSPSKSKSISEIKLVSVDKSLVSNLKKNIKLIENLRKSYSEFNKEIDIVKLNNFLKRFSKLFILNHFDYRLKKDDIESMDKRFQILLNRLVTKDKKKFSELYQQLYIELITFISENEIKKGKEIEKLGLLISQLFLDILFYSEIVNSFYSVFVKNSNEKKTEEELNDELKTLALVERLIKTKINLLEKYQLVLIRRLITGGK